MERDDFWKEEKGRNEEIMFVDRKGGLWKGRKGRRKDRKGRNNICNVEREEG